MEHQRSLGRIDEEDNILEEECVSKVSLTKLLESNEDITQLTERCSELAGTNTKLEQQVKV